MQLCKTPRKLLPAVLVPTTQPTPVPAVIGLGEAIEVRNAASAFEGWDAVYGGGLVREAVTAQLRYCAQLLGARGSDQVRTEMFSAVGYLAHVQHRLGMAVTGHGDEFARGRAISQTKLASLIMAVGDPIEAATAGTQALDWLGTIRSRRAADDLRDLRRFARRHNQLTEVDELRLRIGSAVIM